MCWQILRGNLEIVPPISPKEMSKASGKKCVIEISSSSSDESDEFSDSRSSEPSEDDYKDEETDSNESDCVELSPGSSDKDDEFNVLDEASICTRVSQLVRDGGDLQGLSLKDFKLYLRTNGLRLSGTKAECIGRIKEHWRLKDGSGEGLYPRSSFTINCTGDVCKGDVVLFTQKVHTKMRSGSVSGKRTIAGRIVKESYGAARQQHTFTVEVVWSKGLKALPAMYPLLVKGRNLYKLRTFRQRWKNEGERSLVLDEKHNRGAAARSIRDRRWRESARRTEANTSRKTGRAKHQKGKHVSGHGQLKQTNDAVKGKGVGGKSSLGKKRSYDYHDEFLPPRQLNLEKATNTSHKRQRLVDANSFRESIFQSNHGPQPRQPNSSPPRYSHSTYWPNLSYSPVSSRMPLDHQQLAHASYPHPGPQHRQPNNFPPLYSHSTYLPNSSDYPDSFGRHVERQQFSHASYRHHDPPIFSFEGRSRYRHHDPPDFSFEGPSRYTYHLPR